MDTVGIHLKSEIEPLLRRSPGLHLYSLGDLDDFFWPYTRWFALKQESELLEPLLLYDSPGVPTLLAFTENPEAMGSLLQSLSAELPREFYGHFSEGLEEALKGSHRLTPLSRQHRMTLTQPSRVWEAETSNVTGLDESDLDQLLDFYETHYPENWFDPRMLKTGQYFGIKEGPSLVAAGGIHVFSEQYRVAALGNIATHREFRRRGLCTAVTARLCQSLLSKVSLIGLNVKAENEAAIACYEKLGFEVLTSFREVRAERIQPARKFAQKTD